MEAGETITLTAILHKGTAFIFGNLTRIGWVAFAGGAVWLGMNWEMVKYSMDSSEKHFSAQDTINVATSKHLNALELQVQTSAAKYEVKTEAIIKTQDAQGVILEEIRKTQNEMYKMYAEDRKARR